MACDPKELTHVPLFALLDDEEAAVLAPQVELKRFAPRQRIYRIGDPPQHAYVMLSGAVRVTTVDEDHQEVLIDEPGHGDFNRRAGADIQGLANKLSFLTDQVGDVEDLLREALTRRADSKPSVP